MQRNFSRGNIRGRFGIVGTGVSGQAAISLLRALGVKDDAIVTFDAKDPKAHFNDPALFLQQNTGKEIDTLVISPGVPLRTPWIQQAKQRGIQLTSELEIAFSQITDEYVIGITGSLGKSTTTALIGHALKAVDENVFVGGNLGLPLAQYATDLLVGSREKAKYVVLELSSYQLELFDNLKANAAIFTFFSPNHLERYDSLNEYYETKWALFSKASDVVLANARGGDLKKFVAAKNASVIWCSRDDDRMKKRNIFTSAMVGAHNLDNLALAVGLFDSLGITDRCLPLALQFSGLPHRLQRLNSYNGITFINDSKATALDSVIEACHSVLPEIQAGGTLWLLLGGKDKNLPWEEISGLGELKNIRFTFFGECAEKAKTKSHLPGSMFAKLSEALEHVVSQAENSDFVLLSPGGTSQDEFKNFEERGEFFKRWLEQKFKDS